MTKWTKLGKRDKQHLKEIANVTTKAQFVEMRQDQARLKLTCWECRSIALKTGIER